MRDQARILFVTLTNDVGSDRIVSDLGRHGATCAVLGPRGCFASLVRCVSACFDIAGRLGPLAAPFALRRRLAAAVSAWGPDRIVPLDELSALLLRSIGSDLRTPLDLRAILVRSLGSPAGYAAACHRLPLMQVARRLGVRTPAFWAEDDRQDIRFPLMVKRDHSSGAAGVVRVEDRAGLVGALRAARVKTQVKRLMARAAGFDRHATPTLLQSYVPGPLAMHTVACRDGEVIDGASFLALEIHPQKRASTVLRSIVHSEMIEAARRIIASLGCSGFVSFDFVLDAANRAFLIEMNARPIGSTHLGRLFGHDLAFAFLRGEPLPVEPLHRSDEPVVLFPKELERDPSSSYLATGATAIHDVPATEPAVLAAYLAHLEAVHPDRRADIRAQVQQPVPPEERRPWRSLGHARSF